MNEATKFIAAVASLLGAFILLLMLLFAALSDPPQRQRQMTQEEQEQFMKVREKHFHKGQASIVVVPWEGPEYFMRGGKRCEFK